MTTVKATLFFLLALACNAPEFVAGDCAQKPDSMIVWKVEKIEGKQLELSQNQNPQMPATQTSSINDGWIKTVCPDG